MHAPPPVLTCFICPAMPAALTAATMCPPPIIVNAGERAIALSTSNVPLA